MGVDIDIGHQDPTNHLMYASENAPGGMPAVLVAVHCFFVDRSSSISYS